MGLGIQVTVQDQVTSKLKGLIDGLRPEQLNPVVGRSAANSYKAYLTALDAERPNVMGGPRTHFFLQAARATSFRIVGDAVVVSIAHVGMAQRYFGGTIRPRTAKFLTIPAVPEAHGKRAREFSDLHFSFERNPATGHLQRCLVQGERSLLATRRGPKGVRTYFAGSQARRVIFWLVRSVTQAADESVLPRPELVAARAVQDAAAYARLLLQRRGGIS